MKPKLTIGLCTLILILLLPAPFSYSIPYSEKLTKPSMTDNSYSIAVSNFIKEKCDLSNDGIGCKDIIIIGDDFVVPGYRREIPTLEKKWIFFNNKDVKNIYTDIPYIKKKTLQFSNYYEMFKIDGKYQGKNVLFVLPDSITNEQSAQIERLKQALIDKE